MVLNLSSVVPWCSLNRRLCKQWRLIQAHGFFSFWPAIMFQCVREMLTLCCPCLCGLETGFQEICLHRKSLSQTDCVENGKRKIKDVSFSCTLPGHVDNHCLGTAIWTSTGHGGMQCQLFPWLQSKGHRRPPGVDTCDVQWPCVSSSNRMRHRKHREQYWEYSTSLGYRRRITINVTKYGE